MDTHRRKNAALAINAILRGLEFDQLVFRYDDTAFPDIAYEAGGRDVAERESFTNLIGTTWSALRELAQHEQTTTAA